MARHRAAIASALAAASPVRSLLLITALLFLFARWNSRNAPTEELLSTSKAQLAHALHRAMPDSAPPLPGAAQYRQASLADQAFLPPSRDGVGSAAFDHSGSHTAAGRRPTASISHRGQMLSEMVPIWSGTGKGDFETGVNAPGSQDHTILMALSWSSPWAEKRQWVLNFGQWDGGAEHWLWQGGDSIQFGRWGAP